MPVFFNGERVWHTLLQTRYVYIEPSSEFQDESYVRVTSWESDDSFDALLLVQTDLLRSDTVIHGSGRDA